MENMGLSEELKASLLVTLMEQGSDALIYADKEGIIQVWNHGAENIFGHAPAEAIGQSLDIIIPEKLRAAHWKGFHAALESNTMKYKDQVMTTRAVHKDGSTRYVDLSFFMTHDDQGQPLGSLSLARNVTERYLQERELKKKLADFQTAAPSASGA